jgi:hypothetical protein
MTPRGGTLVVRIDSVTLGPIKDSAAWDNISGVAMIGGYGGPCGRPQDITLRR